VPVGYSIVLYSTGVLQLLLYAYILLRYVYVCIIKDEICNLITVVNKMGNVRINVTSRRVSVTVVAVEKQ
jgi:hypothetical protein